MEKADLKLGQAYAYRRTRDLGGPVLRVVPTLKVGHGPQVRVRFEDGDYPGLEEYVHCQFLRCPYGQHEQLLRDERRLLAVREGPEPPDKITMVAVDLVLHSTGEELRPWSPTAPVTASPRP